jgi:hypothetical protein
MSGTNGYPGAPTLMRHLAYREAVTRVMRAIVTRPAMPDKMAIDKIISFRRLWGMPVPNTGDPRDYLVAMHRARLRWPLLTVEEQNWSAHWLIRQGYSTDVDTVFAPRPEQDKPPAASKAEK